MTVRPAAYMLTPNDGVITFDTFDQAVEWLDRQLDSVKRSREAVQKHDAVLAEMKRPGRG